MKYSALIALVTVTGLVMSVMPRIADARVGESRAAFENRLFKNGGISYRNRNERESRRKGGPYTSYLKYLGNSAEVRIYFKSDDGRELTQSDVDNRSLGSGWEVHVLYVRGKSVLELYKRTGSISEYEMNALLGILGDGAYWKKVEKTQVIEGEPEEEEPVSAFGFDYLRSDEAVRAKKSGGGLMVFQKQLDEFLAKQHESKLIQSAPQSVQGF